MIQLHQNTVWQFLENLNILLPCHQVIQSLAFTQRSKLVENLCLHKHLHIDIYSSFSYNCPNLEASKISSSMWMAKVQHIQTKQYLATKRNTLPSNANTWEKFKCILLSKISQSEKATYCLIPVIWHSRKGKAMETLKRSMVARSYREGRNEQVGQRIFMMVKLFCGTIMGNTCCYNFFSHTYRIYHAMNVKYGLCVIMICQYR